ncbi:MAG: hypothetical protein ACRC2T_19670 [Thermoguttaceae bacterium]
MPQIFYAIPLIIVFSLVYAGTRHELPRPIFTHALRFAGSIVLLMLVIAGLFELVFLLKG